VSASLKARFAVAEQDYNAFKSAPKKHREQLPDRIPVGFLAVTREMGNKIRSEQAETGISYPDLMRRALEKYYETPVDASSSGDDSPFL
jgi:hypothetical protein